jgi:polyhydroxybutyrate depolymerase
MPSSPAGTAIVWLHGYSGTAAATRANEIDLLDVADAAGITVVWAQGSGATPAWAATDACCWLAGAPVPDDVAYLSRILDALERSGHHTIYLVGSSNGGFMVHRAALELGNRLAGVASLKGATWLDVAKHTPVAPVPLLHVHGTADTSIRPEGGTWNQALGAHPSVTTGLERWIGTNGAGAQTAGASGWVATTGDHEVSANYWPGEYRVERWDVVDGDHFVAWTPEFYARLVTWLTTHGRTP